MDWDNKTIVKFLIEGNWGHPRKRGLTEIKFLDQNLHEYIVNENEVHFQVDDKTVNSSMLKVMNLFNNKVATVDSKDMFSWLFKSVNQLVSLTVEIPREF